MTSPSYPAALDALANPGPTTETDDAGFELDIVVSRLQNIAMAIEQKLGIGTGGPPASAAVLRRTATGASAWGPIQAGEIAAGAGPQLIASVGPLASAQALWDVTSIPQVYRTLELRYQGRSTAATTVQTVGLWPNIDTSASYMNQTLLGVGTTASAGEGVLQTYADAGIVPGAGPGPLVPAGWMGSGSVWIHNYTATGIYKSIHGLGHVAFGVAAGSDYTFIKGVTYGGGGGAAITSLRLAPVSGSWEVGTVLALYGHP